MAHIDVLYPLDLANIRLLNQLTLIDSSLYIHMIMNGMHVTIRLYVQSIYQLNIFNIPCVEQGLVSFEINEREHNFGTSSRHISAISDAFRTFSDNKSIYALKM